MTPIDTKLYELFYDGVNPPQLHDVFRVWKDMWVLFNLSSKDNEIFPYNGSEIIPYNPTLSLMNQEESTKQSIVDLFSN